MGIAKPSLVYRYGAGLYVNLTNRCPTSCVFCIKHTWKMEYRGRNLDLDGNEPDPDLLVDLIVKEWAGDGFDELVFCGYGEPTMRLGAMLAVSGAVRHGGALPVPPGLRIRLNTNGLGSLVNGRNIVPELKGLVDAVHISLNTADQDQWLSIMRPRPEYASEGFQSVLDFIRGAAGAIPETVITAVRRADVDIEKFSALAREVGAGCRLRDGLFTEIADGNFRRD